MQLKNTDVLAWKGGQSRAKLPRAEENLANMSEIQVRRSSTDVIYKTSHDKADHVQLDFLKVNPKKNLPGPHNPATLSEQDSRMPTPKSKARIAFKQKQNYLPSCYRTGGSSGEHCSFRTLLMALMTTAYHMHSNRNTGTACRRLVEYRILHEIK